MILKIVFIIAAIGGIVAIFYASWFWRALLIPMMILLLADLVMSFLKRKH